MEQIIVITWSDGTRNNFSSTRNAVDSFIEWKLNKSPDLTYTKEIMSLAEFKKRTDLHWSFPS